MASNIYFVSGIDTDAGKSYATGWYARSLMLQGKKVITQKFIQTGSSDGLDDIAVHRRIMGIDLLPVDEDHTTAPLVFTHPASPHLAAKIDGRDISLSAVDKALKKLKKQYDVVLIEGAGGLLVPVTDQFLTIDYPQNRNLPVILVTNGKLGSINHTLLSLEALKRRNMRLEAVLYNDWYDSLDPVVAADAFEFISQRVARMFRNVPVIRIPVITPQLLETSPKPPAPPAPPHQLGISKLALAEMAQVTFPGTITVIEHRTQALEALTWLKRQKMVGFDTETRPSFRKGRMNKPSLIQISTPRRCFLFRINKLGFIPELRAFLENPKVQKIGLSVRDDFNSLRRVEPTFQPDGFVELQTFVRDFDIVDSSLQKIYGIIFGKRISKNQRLSNWEADSLSEGQKIYAAIDAWASLRIYRHLSEGKFDPSKSPYTIKPE